MSFQFLPNLILIISAIGILVLVLRRLPEVVEERGQLPISAVSAPDNRAFLQRLGASIKLSLAKLLHKIWHFMLEAKDLKQSQALAAKFAHIFTPSSKRIINIGVYSSLKKANRLVSEGDLEGAEDTFISILKKHPHEYAAYEGLVRIYLKQKNYPDLTEALQYLIKHNPENDSYLAQLGNVSMSTRRYAEAISFYEHSLQINNLVAARFANLGLCYEATGELGKASQNFQKAADLEPSNIQYLMMIVDILLKMQENDKAKKKLEQASEMHPDNVLIKEKLIELESAPQN